MKIPTLPFTVTDWKRVPRPTFRRTASAVAHAQLGDLRVRMSSIRRGLPRDHWCDRGQVLYVLEGELDSELRDGRRSS